jgi:hypothetical protein
MVIKDACPCKSLHGNPTASWGLAFTGFPYAIAPKTGNPGVGVVSMTLAFATLRGRVRRG